MFDCFHFGEQFSLVHAGIEYVSWILTGLMIRQFSLYKTTDLSSGRHCTTWKIARGGQSVVAATEKVQSTIFLIKEKEIILIRDILENEVLSIIVFDMS